MGCNPAKNDIVANTNVVLNKDLINSKVIIYLRAVEVNGDKYLYMYDSNGNSSIGDLKSPKDFKTNVKPGSEVFWELERHGGIKKILLIKSSHENGNIFKDVPAAIPFTSGKAFYLKLQNDIEGEEKYSIEVRFKDNTEKLFDPFLRLPPVDTVPKE